MAVFASTSEIGCPCVTPSHAAVTAHTEQHLRHLFLCRYIRLAVELVSADVAFKGQFLERERLETVCNDCGLALANHRQLLSRRKILVPVVVIEFAHKAVIGERPELFSVIRYATYAPLGFKFRKLVTAGTLVPFTVHHVAAPRLMKGIELQTVETVFTHAVAEAIGRLGGFLKQLVVQPVLGNPFKIRACHTHDALAVLGTACNEVDRTSDTCETVRSLKAEAVGHGVGRTDPVFIVSGTTLEHVDALRAEHIQSRADRIETVHIVRT